MWHRGGAGEQAPSRIESGPAVVDATCRRAYYRVAGMLPIRLTPLSLDEVDAAIFDLALPDPLHPPLAEGEQDSPLADRLRRIEEKLDRLLGQARIDLPQPLSGKDRQPLVFSGSGLCLDVTWCFRRGDPYKVEILLPPPYVRLVRAVGEAVADAPSEIAGEGLRPLALSLAHMEDEDRDALVAYSYDLQRIALRARGEGGGRA